MDQYIYINIYIYKYNNNQINRKHIASRPLKSTQTHTHRQTHTNQSIVSIKTIYYLLQIKGQTVCFGYGGNALYLAVYLFVRCHVTIDVRRRAHMFDNFKGVLDLSLRVVAQSRQLTKH